MKILSRRNFVIGALTMLPVVAVVLAGGFTDSMGQSDEAVSWRFQWDAPTTGSPVHHYIVEVRRDGSVIQHQEVTPDNQRVFVFDAFIDHDYEVRVFAVDSRGRLGRPSEWSQRETCDRPLPTR